MAYRGKIKEIDKFSSERLDSILTRLYVSFNFRRDVAPKDRAKVRERIDDLFRNKRETKIPEGILSRNGKRSLSFTLNYYTFENYTLRRDKIEAIDKYIRTGEKRPEIES
jgi:hypothetical protein